MTQASQQPSTASARTLLVVEDNDLDVELLMMYLKLENISVPVMRAHHGEEALKLLSKAYADDADSFGFVMLLDLNMPIMNGFELLERICNETWYSTLPVFILSTSDQPSDYSKASMFNVQDYAQKPVSVDLIRRVIEYC